MVQLTTSESESMRETTKADDIVRLLVAASKFDLGKCQSNTDTLTHTGTHFRSHGSC